MRAISVPMVTFSPNSSFYFGKFFESTVRRDKGTKSFSNALTENDLKYIQQQIRNKQLIKPIEVSARSKRGYAYAGRVLGLETFPADLVQSFNTFSL